MKEPSNEDYGSGGEDEDDGNDGQRSDEVAAMAGWRRASSGGHVEQRAPKVLSWAFLRSSGVVFFSGRWFHLESGQRNGSKGGRPRSAATPPILRCKLERGVADKIYMQVTALCTLLQL